MKPSLCTSWRTASRQATSQATGASTAMRKGTHDFYSERGLALTTWNGEHFVGQGDAFMKPADADRAANAVRDSLAQLVDSFEGKVELTSLRRPKLRGTRTLQCLQGSAISCSVRYPHRYPPSCTLF